MSITNTELAARLQTVADGWQSFVVQQIAWITSDAALLTLRDPQNPSNTYQAKPLKKILGDFDALFGPASSALQQAQTLLTNAITVSTNIEGMVTATTAARDQAVAAASTVTTAATNAENAKNTAIAMRNDAQTAANSAVSSASTATTQATAASTSASAAATSVTAAASSATTAQGHRTAAETAATQAATSASGASSSATSASSSTSTAVAARAAAETARDQAQSSASAANTSAGSSATSATSAATSATSAASSASSAQTARTGAEAARTAAEVARDQAQQIAGGAVPISQVTGLRAELDVKGSTNGPNVWSGMQTLRNGAAGTQAFSLTLGWLTQNIRWGFVLEADATLSIYGYGPAGESRGRKLGIAQNAQEQINAVDAIYYAGNRVLDLGFSARVSGSNREGAVPRWDPGQNGYVANQNATNVADWNDARMHGWYMGFNAANAATSGWLIGRTTVHNDSWVTQEVWEFTASNQAERPMWIRQAHDEGGVRTWNAWTARSRIAQSASFVPTTTDCQSSAHTSSGQFGGGIVQRAGSVWTGSWTNPTEQSLNWGIGSASGLQLRMRLTSAGIEDTLGFVRNVPVLVQNSNYTVTAGERGRDIVKTGTTTTNCSLPNNANLPVETGFSFMAVNHGTVGNLTITPEVPLSLRRGTTTGTVTLLPGESAWVKCYGPNDWRAF